MDRGELRTTRKGITVYRGDIVGDDKTLQRLAVLEGRLVDNQQLRRYLNRLQRLTTIECGRAEGYQVGWQRHLTQLGAAIKYRVVNLGNSIRQRSLNKLLAITKTLAWQLLYARRNLYCSEGYTIRKTVLANRCYATAEGYARQQITRPKSIASKTLDAVRNSNRAQIVARLKSFIAYTLKPLIQSNIHQVGATFKGLISQGLDIRSKDHRLEIC